MAEDFADQGNAHRPDLRVLRDPVHDLVDPTDTDVLTHADHGQLAEARTGACAWGAIVTIDFPSEVQRHPRLIEVVRETVGRSCATQEADHSITVGFGAYGHELEEARADSQEVIGHLLGMLGFGLEAVSEGRLVPSDDDDPTGEHGHLLILPDPPLTFTGR